MATKKVSEMQAAQAVIDNDFLPAAEVFLSSQCADGLFGKVLPKEDGLPTSANRQAVIQDIAEDLKKFQGLLERGNKLADSLKLSLGDKVKMRATQRRL